MKLSLKKILAETDFQNLSNVAIEISRQMEELRQTQPQNKETYRKLHSNLQNILNQIETQFGPKAMAQAEEKAMSNMDLGSGDPTKFDPMPTPEQISKIKQTQNVYNRGQEKMKRLNRLQKRWGTTPVSAPNSSLPSGLSTTAGQKDTDTSEPNTVLSKGTKFAKLRK